MGGNFIRHVVRLDVEMRRVGRSENVDELHPSFVSFDCAAAIPSHGGSVDLSAAMCYAPASSVWVDGARRATFAIESEVAQGCPVSGSAW
eukprot:2254995-Pyramimonas_sp.AAC.1